MSVNQQDISRIFPEFKNTELSFSGHFDFHKQLELLESEMHQRYPGIDNKTWKRARFLFTELYQNATKHSSKGMVWSGISFSDTAIKLYSINDLSKADKSRIQQITAELKELPASAMREEIKRRNMSVSNAGTGLYHMFLKSSKNPVFRFALRADEWYVLSKLIIYVSTSY
ncbi:MAG: hypothetical protein ACLFM1_00425 [Bacteroidales bacterium]